MAAIMNLLDFSSAEKASFFMPQQAKEGRESHSFSEPSSFQDALKKVSEQFQPKEKENSVSNDQKNLSGTEKNKTAEQNSLKKESKSAVTQDSEKNPPLKQETRKSAENLASLMDQISGYLNPAQRFDQGHGKKNQAGETILNPAALIHQAGELASRLQRILAQGQNQGEKQEFSAKQIQTLKGFQSKLQELTAGFQKNLAQEPQKILAGMDLALNASRAPQDNSSGERRIFDIRFEKGLRAKLKDMKNTLSQSSENGKSLDKPGNLLAQSLKQELQKPDSLQKGEMVSEIRQHKKEAVKPETKDQENFKTGLKEKSFDATLALKNEIGSKENSNPVSKLQPAQKAELGKQILSQIGDKVQGFIGKNFSHLTVELKPEHLGNLKIVLDMKNEAIRGRIVVENAQVKEVVQDHLQQVKSILEGSGIQLESLEVSTRQEQNSGHQQQQNSRLQEAITRGYQTHALMEGFSHHESYDRIQEDTLELSGRLFVTA